MNALIYVQRSGMPLRALRAGDLPGSEVKETDSELTFVSFSYKRNGFASFATKRRKMTYLTWIIHKNPQ